MATIPLRGARKQQGERCVSVRARRRFDLAPGSLAMAVAYGAADGFSYICAVYTCDCGSRTAMHAHKAGVLLLDGLAVKDQKGWLTSAPTVQQATLKARSTSNDRGTRRIRPLAG